MLITEITISIIDIYIYSSILNVYTLDVIGNVVYAHIEILTINRLLSNGTGPYIIDWNS